jgi:Protein of unknown function (DUF3261)
VAGGRNTAATIRQWCGRTAQAAALAASVTLLCAAAGTGCAHHGAPAPAAPPGSSATSAPASAGILPPPDAIPGTFTVRQKIVARSKHGTGGFEGVLQKQPGRLTLLGLTPYGSRAFLLEQSATSGVKLTSYIPRELPFSPEFIVMDIHRVLDDWLGPRPTTDGERAGTVHDERVVERWTGGRLTSRTFSPTSDPAHPITTITYDPPGAAGGLPARVSLVNARLGYSLIIETLPM